jgi:hypothetical protein
MGEERVARMMSLLPPVGWADVATKRDLDVLAERLDAKIDALRVQMAAEVDVHVIQRTFVTWLLTAQARSLLPSGCCSSPCTTVANPTRPRPRGAKDM